MQKTKLIGVTPRLLVEDTTEKEFANTDYLNALRSRGANAIILTLDNPALEEVLDLCDGFLVTGGSDVDPLFYGEKNDGESKGIKPRLDTIDKQVIEYAFKNKVPMLGICRGIQSINVFLGGSLFQDIGTDHKDISGNHEVHTIKNEVLDLDKNILTNSYHHQAVKDLAPNFEAIAWHKDGTIEAIVHETLPFIGIQWHPEKLPTSKESQTIFNKFFEFMNKDK